MKSTSKKLWGSTIALWAIFGLLALTINEHSTREIWQRIGFFIWNILGLTNPPEGSCLPHPFVKFLAYSSGFLLLGSIVFTIFALIFTIKN